MNPSSSKRPFFITLLRFVIPLVIIGAGVLTAQHLYDTRPVADRGRPDIPAPLVETTIVHKQDHQITVSAMGTVVPSRSITLKSRVGGFVETTSEKLIPGGVFQKGEVLLRLEQTDYALDVARKKAALDRLSASLRLEMGQQEVAREEIKILQKDAGSPIVNPSLALREPQLAQIKADIAAAKTDLDLARLNLDRTIIKAPFNCMIMSVNVQTGSQISAQDALAELSGTDAFWVKVSVPPDQLKWITIPANPKKKGSPTIVTDQNNTPHQGHVIRLLGELGPQTRLATLLITIDDPLGQSHPTDAALLLNSYVRVAVQAEKIADVIALPRPLVRNQNQVWVAADGQMEIQTIDFIWRNNEFLFVTRGLDDGDAVIISDLSSPVEGMALRVLEKGTTSAIDPDTGDTTP
ncbi:MAG: efflux RND transporter periplasmic adaptor subunit [Desulfotignum sp.]